MLTTDKQHRERVKICKGCEHYNNGFCGVPLMGDLVDNPDGGRRKRTCGCKVSLKARLAFESCGHPFDKKWLAIKPKDEQRIEQIKRFVEGVGVRLDERQNIQMQKYHAEVKGIEYKHTNCKVCVIEKMQELKQILLGL